MAEARDQGEVWAKSKRSVGAPNPRDRDPRATLLALAERAPSLEEIDHYGEGGLAERLEARIAELLGTEAAVWMPSGTMAQQIALRLHSERRGSRGVAFHPLCHLEEHEERAYEVLHGLKAQLLGSRDRLIRASDLDELEDPVAAVLLELPERELGGLLPAWDELVAICAKAREQNAALHLDGARLWQCGPFYERGLDEIAALFDTVYVSFYKDLGAPAGAALAGPAELIEEARVWQVRHGGRLYSVHPYLIAAERGLDEVLPRIPELVAHARELGMALAELDGIEIVPDPPQTTMFHVYVRRPLEPLQEAALDQAERTGTFLGFVRATDDPERQRLELTIGLAGLEVPVGETKALWQELLTTVAQPSPRLVG
ncbi:MAG TPA: beta-eliminating lyase-related protein [Gaiellaceae bacterium]|nr:beta-eliminating lyase-related protein [Gaiellaceae bacterium]